MESAHLITPYNRWNIVSGIIFNFAYFLVVNNNKYYHMLFTYNIISKSAYPITL